MEKIYILVDVNNVFGVEEIKGVYRDIDKATKIARVLYEDIIRQWHDEEEVNEIFEDDGEYEDLFYIREYKVEE